MSRRTSSATPLIQHEILAKLVTRVLPEILCGDLAEGGALLSQNALAQEYGTSRMPLSEALRKLEAKGIVRMYPHRGTVVPTPPLDETAQFAAPFTALRAGEPAADHADRRAA